MYCRGSPRVYDLNFNGRAARQVPTASSFPAAEQEYSRHNFATRIRDAFFEQFRMAAAACKIYPSMPPWSENGIAI